GGVVRLPSSSVAGNSAVREASARSAVCGGPFGIRSDIRDPSRMTTLTPKPSGQEPSSAIQPPTSGRGLRGGGLHDRRDGEHRPIRRSTTSGVDRLGRGGGGQGVVGTSGVSPVTRLAWATK